MNIADCFYIGYISKTRGLKGELQLFFEFDDYAALELDTLFVEVDRRLVPFFVASTKVHANGTAYLTLEDVDHIDQAQPLVRKKVYLPLSRMPERHPDDFRLADLKGYLVHDQHFGDLGEIIDVHDYPQQHVAVVAYRGKELMFPLNDELILMIDQAGSRIMVDLPDGLVELYS